MIRRNGQSKDIKAQCVQSLVEMFTADGNLDLEDQDHLKCVILKIKIKLPKQRDLEDQDRAHLYHTPHNSHFPTFPITSNTLFHTPSPHPHTFLHISLTPQHVFLHLPHTSPTPLYTSPHPNALPHSSPHTSS